MTAVAPEEGVAMCAVLKREMELSRFTRALGAVLAAATLLVAGGSPAYAEWPERPITMIIPWAAGGGTDATGRILASLMEQKLGQTINVVNRPGGGGVVGHSEISNAKPDGYTLGLITTELSMYSLTGSSELTYENYRLLGLYNSDPYILSVRVDSPFKTAEDLMAALRADANKVKVAGTNQGGPNHLAYVRLVKALGGNKAFWVPAEGAAPALQLLASGAVDVVISGIAEAESLIGAGEIRAITYMDSKRSDYLPDVSSAAEAGNIEFVTISGWRGLAGPKGLPDEVVSKIEEALAEVAGSAEFLEFMNSKKYNVSVLSAKDFEEYLAVRQQAFGDALRDAGLIQ